MCNRNYSQGRVLTLPCLAKRKSKAVVYESKRKKKHQLFKSQTKNTTFKYHRTCLAPVEIVTLSLLRYKALAKNMSLCLEEL
jgi:hypothetical protein